MIFTEAVGGLGSVRRWTPTIGSTMRGEFQGQTTFAISMDSHWAVQFASRSFFVDLEFTRQHDPVNMNGTVPTDAERNGDFSQTLTADANGNPVQQTIYNPYLISCVPNPPPATGCTPTRPAFTNNVIDPQYINPIGQALLKLYPEP